MKKRIKALVLVLSMMIACLGASGITAGAASFSVAPQISDSPDAQKFVITNGGADDNFIFEGQSVFVAGGQSQAITVAGSGRMTIGVSRESTGEKVFVNSLNEHFVTIYSQYGDSAPAVSGTTSVSLDEGQKRVSVDEMVSSGSDVYRCANNSAFVSYGNASVTFQYAKVQRDPRTVTVYFIDENGYSIGNDQFQIAPNGSAVYNVPASMTVNGKNYNLASGQPASISQDYSNTTSSYTVIYQGEAQKPSSPYTISVRYEDADTGRLLTNNTVTVPVGGAVNYEVAASYVTSDYSEYQRAAGQPSVITHTSGESTRSYTVLFTKVAGQNPYTINVRCIDSVTGTLLESASQTVEVNATVSYSLKSSLSYKGNEYLLASGQGTEIRHSFGGSQRTYYVYYNQAGAEIPSEYGVTVRYIDITSNSTIHTETMTAAGGQNLTIGVPTSYQSGSEEYVLLSGQSDSVSHNFYSPRRTYAFYFRNVNDTANENAQVNEVVEVVEIAGEQVEQVVTNVVTPPAEEGGEPETVIYNENGEQINENGEPVNIPDESVPAGPTVPETTEEETEPETVQIEDETVPMAPAVPSAGTPAGLIAGISLGVLALVAAIAAFIIVKKKKKEEA